MIIMYNNNNSKIFLSRVLESLQDIPALNFQPLCNYYYLFMEWQTFFFFWDLSFKKKVSENAWTFYEIECLANICSCKTETSASGQKSQNVNLSGLQLTKENAHCIWFWFLGQKSKNCKILFSRNTPDCKDYKIKCIFRMINVKN